jgi:hypothetical protein
MVGSHISTELIKSDMAPQLNPDRNPGVTRHQSKETLPVINAWTNYSLTVFIKFLEKHKIY